MTNPLIDFAAVDHHWVAINALRRDLYTARNDHDRKVIQDAIDYFVAQVDKLQSGE